jgi:two-component system, LytTR family, response regulator LytT
MTTLFALIVDDEAPARAELRFLLEAHDDVEVVGEAASVRVALALASRLEYDVVFLDISMPGATGMDAARTIADWPKRPAVVFVTAHDDHAIQAFSVDAVDYLLKPVAPQRLAQCLSRVRAVRAAPAGASRVEPPLEKVAVTRRGETLLVGYDEILYAEADGDYCWITTDNDRLLCSQSMRELEDALPATLFFRIHRSFLVNLAHVAAVEQVAPGRAGLRLDNDALLEVARRQTRALKHHLRLRS